MITLHQYEYNCQTVHHFQLILFVINHYLSSIPNDYSHAAKMNIIQIVQRIKMKVTMMKVTMMKVTMMKGNPDVKVFFFGNQTMQ